MVLEEGGGVFSRNWNDEVPHEKSGEIFFETVGGNVTGDLFITTFPIVFNLINFE